MARKPRQATTDDIIVDLHAKARALAREVTPGDGLTRGDIAAAALATLIADELAPVVAQARPELERVRRRRPGQVKRAELARKAKAEKIADGVPDVDGLQRLTSPQLRRLVQRYRDYGRCGTRTLRLHMREKGYRVGREKIAEALRFLARAGRR